MLRLPGRVTRVIAACLVALTPGARLIAQGGPPAARPLGATVARSEDRALNRGSPETGIAARELSDGRVILLRDDTTVVLLDSTLRQLRRVGRVGTSGALPQVWQTPDDVTMFATWIGGAFDVVNPAGKRVDDSKYISAPSKINLFAGGPRGGWLDPDGRFLILAELPSAAAYDSGMLVWVDFRGRYQEAGVVVRTRSRRGGVLTTDAIDLNDTWAVLPNGTLVVIRTTSCRIEVVPLGGVRIGYPPVPCESRTLTPDETRRRLGAVGQATGAAQTPPLFEPAYMPLSILADPRGRVWIARNPFLQKDPYGDRTYDVIDDEGHIVDTVIVPKDRCLVGVGRDVVFLVRLSDGRLDRVRIR